MIRSANPEVEEEYNFFNSVCGSPEAEVWFGYRVLGHSNFGQFCGATNMLNIGTSITELEILHSVNDENVAAGFGDIADVYQPESLIEFYGYKFPDPAALPPGLLKIPFVARNGEDDEPLDNDQPPWLQTYFGPPSPVIDDMLGSVIPQGVSPPRRPAGTEAPEEDDDDDDDEDDDGPPSGRMSVGGLLSPARSIRGRDDDTQSSGLGGSPPKGGTPGSTPLGDATLSQNSESGPSPGRPVKRRRAGNRFVATEADDEDGDAEQVRYLAHTHASPLTPCPHGGPMPFSFELIY